MMKLTIYLPVVAALLVADATPTQVPRRGAEVERLAFLVGTFEGEVRYAPPGAAPQTGRMTYRGEWDLDGWIVRSRYDQKMGNTRGISGLLIFRWRPKDSIYAFEGYANTPMEPHRLEGRWVDGLIFEGTMMGTPLRERWHARGGDTLVNTMEFERDGHWTKVSEALLVRQKP